MVNCTVALCVRANLARMSSAWNIAVANPAKTGTQAFVRKRGNKMFGTIHALFPKESKNKKSNFRFTAWYKFKVIGKSKWFTGRIKFRPSDEFDYGVLKEALTLNLLEDFIEDAVPVVELKYITKEEYEQLEFDNGRKQAQAD